jgi:hypothetical protein
MKMKKTITINTDQQLINCIHSNIDVEVWVAGIFDCLSKIISYNEISVSLEDGNYLRDNCVIKASSYYLVLVK